MQAQNAIAEMHNSTTMEVSCVNLVFSDSLECFGNNCDLLDSWCSKCFEIHQLV